MKSRVLLYLLLIPLIGIGFIWLFLQASALLTGTNRSETIRGIQSPTAFSLTPTSAILSASPSPSPTIRMIVGPFNQQQAPEFALNTLDGHPIKLGDYQGKVLLINFWASWCGPCKEEMPLLQTAYEKYKDRGLVVLGINTTYQDNRKDAETFARNTAVQFPILLDESGSVSQDYRVISIPMSFFIDPNGTIRHYQMGAMNASQLQQELDDMIK